MRFKQFISESRSKDLSLEEAAEWIKKNSKIMVEELKLEEQANLLYRGKSGGLKPQIGDSRESVRMSSNTSNEYTLLIDSSPAWKRFPKRSKSFICTSSEGYAQPFGPVQMVFPKDSTLMACASARDFWMAFPLLKMLDISSMKILNSYMVRMIELNGENSHQTDSSILRQRLSAITGDLIKAEAPDSFYTKLTLSAMKKLKVNTVEQLVDKLLDPDENGLHTFNMDQWEDFHADNNEYWFADEAVFVPVGMKSRLLEILK
jgi:hypothetical protein